MASIDIQKWTCAIGEGEDGQDNDNPTLIVGEEVTWFYVVTNDGDHDIAGASVVVSDNTALGVITRVNNGDNDLDNILSAGESWTYTQTGTVEAVEYSNTGSVTASTVDLGWGTVDRDDSDGSG